MAALSRGCKPRIAHHLHFLVNTVTEIRIQEIFIIHRKDFQVLFRKLMSYFYCISRFNPNLYADGKVIVFFYVYERKFYFSRFLPIFF